MSLKDRLKKGKLTLIPQEQTSQNVSSVDRNFDPLSFGDLLISGEKTEQSTDQLIR
eukprot:UN24982